MSRVGIRRTVGRRIETVRSSRGVGVRNRRWIRFARNRRRERAIRPAIPTESMELHTYQCNSSREPDRDRRGGGSRGNRTPPTGPDCGWRKMPNGGGMSVRWSGRFERALTGTGVTASRTTCIVNFPHSQSVLFSRIVSPSARRRMASPFAVSVRGSRWLFEGDGVRVGCRSPPLRSRRSSDGGWSRPSRSPRRRTVDSTGSVGVRPGVAPTESVIYTRSRPR